MKTMWVKSKWKKEELEGKSVEYRFPIVGGGFVTGVGKFLIRQNPDGLLAIEIIEIRDGPHWSIKFQVRSPLSQVGVDSITRNSVPGGREFLLA